MPVDSRDKRASAIGVDRVPPRLEQNPSGVIGQSGRQIAGLVYSGILAAGVVAVLDAGALALDLPEWSATTVLGSPGGLT